MKKIALFLVAAGFVAVSCSSNTESTDTTTQDTLQVEEPMKEEAAPAEDATEGAVEEATDAAATEATDAADAAVQEVNTSAK